MTRPFQDLKARLDALGFRPSRRAGQNFLVDPKLPPAIATVLEPLAGRLVLEVGAGTGALTRALAARGARVLAVEKDPRLVTFLREEIPRWGPAGERVRLREADVPAGGPLAPPVVAALGECLGESGGYDCAGSLPYAAAGPILAALAALEPPPARLLFLVQLELAERLLARPGGRAYGTLSALYGLFHDGRLLRRVPPDVFRPRPKVRSALVRFVRRAGSPDAAGAERAAFGRFLQALFGGRRKTLRNALARLGLAEAGRVLPPSLLDRRPAEIAPEDLWRLFRAAGPAPGPGRPAPRG